MALIPRSIRFSIGRAAGKWFLRDRVAQAYAAQRTGDRPLYVQEQMDIHPASSWYKPDFVRETGGFFVAGDPVHRRILDTEPPDYVRRDMLVLMMRMIVEHAVPGDLAELGVYRGSTARVIHHYLPERVLHLFDTFEGFSTVDMERERGRANFSSITASGKESDEAERRTLTSLFKDTSVEDVLRIIDPVNDNVKVYKGFFPSTIPPSLLAGNFALVSLDADIYEPTTAGLEFFYPRVSKGGVILIQDYNAWPGARKASNDFFRLRPEVPIPMPDKSGSALIVKQ